MASTQALCTSFKVDLLKGIHAFAATNTRGTTSADTFYGALILDSAALGAATTAYGGTVGSVTWAATEVSGTGYVAGGAAITNATAPTSTGTTAFWSPSAALTWTTVTLSTAFSALFVFNNTVSTKSAVGVFTFGSTTVTAGNFTINFPAAAAGTALINIA